VFVDVALFEDCLGNQMNWGFFVGMIFLGKIWGYLGWVLQMELGGC
jgi:hypothetical protein